MNFNFFIRNNKAIPFGRKVENTEKLDYNDLKSIGYNGASYEIVN
jgi:hypothetical protein